MPVLGGAPGRRHPFTTRWRMRRLRAVPWRLWIAGGTAHSGSRRLVRPRHDGASLAYASNPWPCSRSFNAFMLIPVRNALHKRSPSMADRSHSPVSSIFMGILPAPTVVD